ncbi:MAG: O-antigen ligase family protein [Rugosibacter sp.]|nr:O-antigen ligase family protein [Rugosibacter sp.]
MSTKNTSLIFTLINLMAVAVVFLGWWPVPGNYFLLKPVLFCAIAVLCLFMLPTGEVRINRRSLVVYAAFAAWVVLADALSGEFVPALARDVHWLILPLLVILYSQLFAKSEDALKVLQVAVALSLVVICYRLIDSADSVFNWVLPPIFGNIRHLAMTVGLMSVFLYYDVGYRQTEKWLFVLARIIGLGLVFWSGSRASMLAWALAFFLIILGTDQRSKWRGWCLEVSAAIALALLLDVGNPSMGFLNAFFRQWSSGSMDGISSGRLTLWLKTIDALRDPYTMFFGAGGNGFVRLQLMWDAQSFQPHNIILQVLSDWGVGGFLLLVLLVKQGTSGRLAWKASKDGKAVLGVALMAFLLVIGLLDAGLYHLQYLFFAAIAFALIAKPVDHGAHDGMASIKRICVPRLGIAALLLAAMFLHWTVRNYRADWPVSPLNQPYVAPHRG